MWPGWPALPGAEPPGVDAVETPAPAAPEVGERKAVFLHPGRIFVSPQPTTVRMILGSCVAVCLWDPGRRTGGANHFLLPYQDSADSPEFGDVAVRRLIENLLAIGCARHGLLAKVFGGSCVLDALQTKESHIGLRNAALAQKLLAEEGIPIVAQDVGGQRARRVIFQTDDGSAWVKRL